MEGGIEMQLFPNYIDLCEAVENLFRVTSVLILRQLVRVVQLKKLLFNKYLIIEYLYL